MKQSASNLNRDTNDYLESYCSNCLNYGECEIQDDWFEFYNAWYNTDIMDDDIHDEIDIKEWGHDKFNTFYCSKLEENL